MSQIIPFPSIRDELHDEAAYRARHAELRRLKAGKEAYRELYKKHRAARLAWLKQEIVMASLDGRPVLTKEADKAERARLAAQRKGETNERTKRKVERTAKAATRSVTDDDVEKIVAQAAANGADPDKVRAKCEDLLRRMPDTGIARLVAMLNEDRKKLA